MLVIMLKPSCFLIQLQQLSEKNQKSKHVYHRIMQGF